LQDGTKAIDVWHALLRCWIYRFSGAPDSIRHDAGVQFMAQEFQTLAGEMGIRCQPIPVKSPHSLGIGERYHGALRRTFESRRVAHPEASSELLLDASVKAANDLMGPDGLVPTLLVFGVYPKLPLKDSSSTAVPCSARLQIMLEARDEYTAIMDNHRLKTALEVQTAQYPSDLRYNDPIVVYRTTTRKWDGPLRYVGESDHGFYIVTANGETKLFQKPCVRRYAAGINYDALEGPASIISTSNPREQVFTQTLERPSGLEDNDEGDVDKSGIASQEVDTGRETFRGNTQDAECSQDALDNQTLRFFDIIGDNATVPKAWEMDGGEDDTPQPRDAAVTAEKDDVKIFYATPFPKTRDEIHSLDAEALATEVLTTTDPRRAHFADAIEKEFTGLADKRVFEDRVIPKHARSDLDILKSRYVLAIKNPGTTAEIKKARLVVTAIRRLDKGSRDLFTYSPTTTKASMRLLFSISAVYADTTIYKRHWSSICVLKV
jgi:hypothetical protein